MAAGIVWDDLAELSVVPGQVYWEVFLSLEAFGGVDNGALRNPEGQ